MVGRCSWGAGVVRARPGDFAITPKADVEINTVRHSPEPHLAQCGKEVQRFGTLRLLPIALAAVARQEGTQLLNGILADTTMLYAMYKKHHWG